VALTDAQLKQMHYNRVHEIADRNLSPMNPFVAALAKQLKKRVSQCGKVQEAFEVCVPPDIRAHTAIQSYHRGALKIACDSSPHRFLLTSMIQSGLAAQMQALCSAPINKIWVIQASLELASPEPKRASKKRA